MKIKKKDFLEAIVWFQSSLRPLKIYVRGKRVDISFISQDEHQYVLDSMEYRLRDFRDNDDILNYYAWCCTFKTLEDKVLKRYYTYMNMFHKYDSNKMQRYVKDLLFYCFLLMVFRDYNQRDFISWEKL